jgi:hypothetical protein
MIRIYPVSAFSSCSGVPAVERGGFAEASGVVIVTHHLNSDRDFVAEDLHLIFEKI